MLNLGQHFDNKSVYFIFCKNPLNFPDDIDKKRLKTSKPFIGSRSPVGARLGFAAITGSNFREESHPLLASSQHVGATAAVTILPLLCWLNNITRILLCLKHWNDLSNHIVFAKMYTFLIEIFD